MRFVHPDLLFLALALAAVLAGLFWWARARCRRFLRNFAGDQVERLSREVSHAKRALRSILIASGVMMLVAALSRPQYGVIERPMPRRGVEVVVAIDCSRSMLSQDISPNRLDRARNQLRGLIRRLRGDHVGIIAFAGIPVVQCPMTSDYDMALGLLDSIDADSVPVPGTAIAAAIRKSFDMFQASGPGSRVLILLTDGEDHEGDLERAAQEAAEKGIVIYAVGIGTPRGGPIPLPEGGFQEFRGATVNTQLDFDSLRRIASITGGKAILANPGGDLELDQILSDMAQLKQADLAEQTLSIHLERFQWFLGAALLFFAVEALLGDRRRSRPRLKPGIPGRREAA